MQKSSLIPHDKYISAIPFPHCAIDDFLDAAKLEKVLQEWPRYIEIKEKTHSIKGAFSDFQKMGETTQEVIQYLNSPEFLKELSFMTGIENLISDPELRGGGLHYIPPGGYLDMHVDFNWHGVLQAERRINLLLYLNKNWKWNGDLIMSGESLNSIRSFPPLFNRCVIFNTSENSWHGHSDPLKAPVARQSIALYYYTRGKKPSNSHSTIYA